MKSILITLAFLVLLTYVVIPLIAVLGALLVIVVPFVAIIGILYVIFMESGWAAVQPKRRKSNSAFHQRRKSHEQTKF